MSRILAIGAKIEELLESPVLHGLKLFDNLMVMETHFSLTDLEFEKQFKECTFDAKLFNHEAHIRLAWIHLNRYGESEAIAKITVQIKAYAESIGEFDIYHETLTVAAIKIVSHFNKKKKCSDFMEFIRNNPRLTSHFKELVNSHYSSDILSSSNAKEVYLEPDRLPFD
jgi:hypothetical protein